VSEASRPISAAPTPRTAVRRKPERASYDEAAVNAILDEALFCHVGVVRDGAPVVIPTIHARHGDHVYLHGSPAAGILRDARGGVEICVAATIVDGLVLARSPRYHSLNYRSVVLFGRVHRLRDKTAKAAALDCLVEHVVAGRSACLRTATPKEIAETEVLQLSLTEASVKIRTGPPLDPDADKDLPIWAGVLPLMLATGEPIEAPGVPPNATVPDHVRTWKRAAT
jgi:nitroimidazol reductase NimA-like FMN-containing flavoprotein (pyridoxamine 5'-phosphate oxidase superfamily)